MADFDFNENILPPSIKQPMPQMDASQLFNNLYTLTHRPEVLAQKQTNNVLGMASQFKTEGLNYDLAQKAQSQIEEFKSDLMDMYKSNSGMQRLTLTPSQKLEVQRKQNDLMQQINWGKQATADWQKAQQLMAAAIQAGTITPEEFQTWSTDWEKNFKSAGKLGEVGNPYLDAVNYLSQRPQRFNQPAYNNPKQWVDFVNEGQRGTFDKDYKIDEAKAEISTQMQGPNWKNTEAMLTSYGVLRPDMSPEQKLDAAAQYARNHFMPRVQPSGGNFSINLGGGKNQFTPTEEMVGNERYHNISGHPTSDTYGNYTGKYTAIRENPDGTASVFMTQIVDPSGKLVGDSDASFDIFMRSVGGKKDPNKAGGYWLPYTKSVEGALQQNNINTNKIKVTKYGEYSPSKAINKKTITLEEARNANKNFKGTDEELIQRYAKQGYTVK